MILSDRFNSLDPLSLDNFRAVEVFKLVKNLNTYIDNHKEDNQARTSYAGNTAKNNKKRYSVKVTDCQVVKTWQTKKIFTVLSMKWIQMN